MLRWRYFAVYLQKATQIGGNKEEVIRVKASNWGLIISREVQSDRQTAADINTQGLPILLFKSKILKEGQN